jgi:hypothetical protein
MAKYDHKVGTKRIKYDPKVGDRKVLYITLRDGKESTKYYRKLRPKKP